MGRSSRGRSRLSVLALTAVAALTMSAFAVSTAEAKKKNKNPVVGAAYTETNDPAGNEVVVFDRKKKGQLKFSDRALTGGDGTAQSVGCGPGCPILDSQYAVVPHPAGFVFAVNAGSDTVTSFQDIALLGGERKRTESRLVQKSEVDSGGDMPESLALSDDGEFLYVLNVNTANSNGTTGNITSFEVTGRGKLKSTGSTQPLLNFSPPEGTPGGAATARGITVSPNRRTLVVSEIAGDGGGPAPGAIDVFKVNRNTGAIQPGVENPSARGFPFGGRFDDDGHLVVPNVENPAANMMSPPVEGTVTTYDVANNGTVTPIGTENTNGVLPCWVAFTPGGLFVYVVNTGAGPPPSITRFEQTDSGTLNFLGELTGDDFASTDAEVTFDGKYLYVLNPSVGNPAAQPSHIDGYKVKDNGGLKPIGESKASADLGPGATGLGVI